MATNVKKINHERLGRWEKRMNEQHSTPMVMVGVGHDHVNGRIMVLTTEDLPDIMVIGFLEKALLELKKGV